MEEFLKKLVYPRKTGGFFLLLQPAERIRKGLAAPSKEFGIHLNSEYFSPALFFV